MYLVFGEDSVKLPEGKASREELKPYIGKEVIAGIRPEDIHDEETYISDPNRADCIVNAYVEVTEMMGAEYYLHLDFNGNKLTIKSPLSDVQSLIDSKQLTKVKFVLDMDNINIFDKETEINLVK